MLVDAVLYIMKLHEYAGYNYGHYVGVISKVTCHRTVGNKVKRNFLYYLAPKRQWL